MTGLKGAVVRVGVTMLAAFAVSDITYATGDSEILAVTGMSFSGGVIHDPVKTMIKVGVA
jgi:hypothetical protein